MWPAGINADQAADWPRLAEARGSPRHDLTLRGASGEPAGRSLCHLLSTQALQIYVIVSALCTRHPLLMSPVAFAHHLMTGAGMCISLRPFGHSRTGLFFGVTELSTIPLDVIDLFKGATSSAGRVAPGGDLFTCLPWLRPRRHPAVAALQRLGRAPSATLPSCCTQASSSCARSSRVPSSSARLSSRSPSSDCALAS